MRSLPLLAGCDKSSLAAAAVEVCVSGDQPVCTDTVRKRTTRRVRDSNHLESTIFVEERGRLPRCIIESDNLAGVADACQPGCPHRCVRIIQRRPLTVVINEAVRA